MTDNLPARQSTPELSANRKLTTLNVDEMIRVANGFWRSGVFKKGKQPMAAEELFVVILAGQEMGLGPAQSVMGISMIEGKPNLSANIQAALLKASGKYDYKAEWGYDEAMVDAHGKPYTNPNYCDVTVSMVADDRVIGVTRFSMADADRAGLLRPSQNGKPSNYLVYPRNMLFARAISNAVAFYAPDSTMTRTYHTGEGDGDPTPEPPKLEAGQPAEPPSEPEAQAAIEEAVPDSEVEVMPEAEGEVRPGESAPEAMERMMREEALPDDTFDPASEPPPPVVTPPQTFAGNDPGPAEPTVETSEHEATLTPGQMRLVHAKCGQLSLTDERRREILTEITGEGHLDRIPRRFMDAILERLNAELEAHGDA